MTHSGPQPLLRTATPHVVCPVDDDRISRCNSGIIQLSSGWVRIGWRELWDYRELLFPCLARRQGPLQQTGVAPAWASPQPLLMRRRFSRACSDAGRRLPRTACPIRPFAFAAMLPWTLFTECGQCGGGQPSWRHHLDHEGLLSRRLLVRPGSPPARRARLLRSSPLVVMRRHVRLVWQRASGQPVLV